MKIFINPGHTPQSDIDAGLDWDVGACGCGLQENIICKQVADLIEQECKKVGIGVKGNFQSMSLYAITDTANATDADILVSIHCNAASAAAKGTETFYCQGSPEGRKIAECVQKEIIAAMGTVDRGVKDDTHTQHGRIHVLRASKMAAILIELAFISNESDAKLLRNNQVEFARAIVKGLCNYGSIGLPAPDVVDTPVDKAERAQDISDERIIWDFFKSKGLPDEAVAGIMGNLYAESGLKSTNLENYYEQQLGMSDEEYTKAVDYGTYTNFVNDKAGYGLAQWTYYTRKQKLLTFAKAKGKSIGDLSMQLDFLWEELQAYTSLMDYLRGADYVDVASTAFLLDFERPADQNIAAQKKRAGFAQSFYDEFAGTTNINDDVEMTEMRYNKVTDLPDWAKSTIQKMINKGFIGGSGAKDADGNPLELDLSLDMIRIFVINDRAGLYD